eukprot:2096255-Pleurochrysis_carterae.AAC.1
MMGVKGMKGMTSGARVTRARSSVRETRTQLPTQSPLSSTQLQPPPESSEESGRSCVKKPRVCVRRPTATISTANASAAAGEAAMTRAKSRVSEAKAGVQGVQADGGKC